MPGLSYQKRLDKKNNLPRNGVHSGRYMIQREFKPQVRNTKNLKLRFVDKHTIVINDNTTNQAITISRAYDKVLYNDWNNMCRRLRRRKHIKSLFEAQLCCAKCSGVTIFSKDCRPEHGVETVV